MSGPGVDPMALLHGAANALVQHASLRGMRFERMWVGGLDTMVGGGGTFGTFTRIQPFLFITVMPPATATSERLRPYAREAVGISVGRKGGLPRGLQSGTVAIHLVVTDRMVPGSGRWPNKMRGSRFAALGYPVVVSLADRTVAHPRRFLLGAAYARPLKRIVREQVTDVLFPGEAAR